MLCLVFANLYLYVNFYNIRVIKLNQNETELLQKNNRFAYAILAGVYSLRSKKDMYTRYQFKRMLMKLILQDNRILHDDKRIYLNTLFTFIDYLLYIPLELKEKLQTELNPLMEKEVRTLMQPMKMDPSPMLKDYIDMKCEEGKKEGIKEGMKKGMEETAKKMLQKSVDIDTIMEFTGLPRDVIVQLQQK